MTSHAIDLPTRRATIRLARRMAPLLVAGDCLVLTGPLGVGKTFFTRALCRKLGLPEHEPVTSPTFTLVNEHPTDPPLAHADAYRLADEDEIRALGLEELRAEGRILVVEWGGPYIDALGGDVVTLELSRSPRRATLGSTGPRSAAIVDAAASADESRAG